MSFPAADMTPPMTRPVLVYTRIAHNRHKTWLLVAFAIASIIPFVLAVSFGVSTIIISEVSGRQHSSRVQSIRMHKQLADMTRDFEGSSFSDQMRIARWNCAARTSARWRWTGRSTCK